MYEHLLNSIIDKSNEDYKDFPDSLDGQIYIGGDKKDGWSTKDNLTHSDIKYQENKTLLTQLEQYLISTDWYVTRSIETGKPIPDDIKKLRQEARERIN